MNQAAWSELKEECTVSFDVTFPKEDRDPESRSFLGTVHIIQYAYDVMFTPWFGSVIVACNMAEFLEVDTVRKARLHLADGLAATISIVGRIGDAAHDVDGRELGEDLKIFYFVGDGPGGPWRHRKK